MRLPDDLFGARLVESHGQGGILRREGRGLPHGRECDRARHSKGKRPGIRKGEDEAAAAVHRKDRFHTGQVLALSVCHFIHDVYSSFLSPLLPLLIEKLSLSLTQAGFLSTVMQIPAFLNPHIGPWPTGSACAFSWCWPRP